MAPEKTCGVGRCIFVFSLGKIYGILDGQRLRVLSKALVNLRTGTGPDSGAWLKIIQRGLDSKGSACSMV